MKGGNPYRQLGLGLAITGVWFSPLAYWLLKSTPLAALGISLVILGAVAIVLGRTRPSLSPEVSALILETGQDNISSLIEELGLKCRAIYLPASYAGGQHRALLPLRAEGAPAVIDKSLPKRLVVKYGPDPQDMAVMLATPGSAVGRLLESMPGPTPAELEDALSTVLNGALDIAEGARFSMDGNRISVDVFKPRGEYRNTRFHQCLGTIFASMAATLTAEAMQKPVIVKSEDLTDARDRIEMEVL